MRRAWIRSNLCENTQESSASSIINWTLGGTLKDSVLGEQAKVKNYSQIRLGWTQIGAYDLASRVFVAYRTSLSKQFMQVDMRILPRSMAQIPVPVPMSKAFSSFVTGARNKP